MDELIEWLRAQLDDDERAARALVGATRMIGTGPDFYGAGGPAAEAFWDRFDPARVLAEVGAKRRLLDQHAKVVDGSQDSWAWFQGSESGSAEILKLLALPFADRPGYRSEWRPA